MMLHEMSDTETSGVIPTAPNVNGTKMELNVTLAEVNDTIALTLLPVILFIGVLMIVGFCGNALVVYVFLFRFRRGTQTFLITWLAIFDLITCLVAMPTEITDIRYFYMFDSVFACKLLTFMTSFCALCSVLTLMGIAVDRYVKICRPLSNQIEMKHVKIWMLITIVSALAFSWPSLILYGIRSAETEVVGLIGRDCSIGDHVKNTEYPLIYNIVLFTGMITATTVLGVLYVFILKAVNAHKNHMKHRTSSVTSVDLHVSTIELSSSNHGSETRIDPQERQLSVSTSCLSSRKQNKTTVIAFSVTAVFVLSFLPHLALMFARNFAKDFDHQLRGASLVAFNIFIRSYFINSVANPIIYGLLNYKFRDECIWLFKRVFLCRRVPSRKRSLRTLSRISR